MADGEITLKVGLDTTSVKQQLNDLMKEVERQAAKAQQELNKIGHGGNNRSTGSNSSTSAGPDVTPQVDMAALAAANARIQELTQRLNELYAQQASGSSALQAANAQIQELQNSLSSLTSGAAQNSWEYINSLLYAPEAQPAMDHIVELMQEANNLTDQLEQNADLEGAQQRLEAIGAEIATIVQTLLQSGQAWERPTREVEDLRNQVAQLEMQLRGLDSGGGASGGTDIGAIAGLISGNGAVAAATAVHTLTKSINTIFKTLKKVAVTVIGITLGVRGLQALINKIRGMVKEGFKAIYDGDKKFKKQVDDLKKSWSELKANLAAAFMPIVQLAIPYIQKLIAWMDELISKAAMFIAAITGQKTFIKVIKKTGEAAGQAAKQLSKFDELNNLTTGGGSDWKTEELPIDPKMYELLEKIKKVIDEIWQKIKELIALPFLEGFLGAIGDWKAKVDEIINNLKRIKDTLIDIFTDPEVTAAAEKYIQALSRAFGALTGLIANIGLNIGMLITGGIASFLEEHAEEIKTDLTNMLTLDTSIMDNFTQLATDISSIFDTIGESEDLQATLESLLSVVYELGSGLAIVALQIADLVSGGIAEIIHENVEKIKEALNSLFELMAKISGFLELVATTIKELLLRLVNEVLVPIFEPVKNIISELLGILLDAWVKIQPLFVWLVDNLTEIWQKYVSPLLHSAMSLLGALAEFVGLMIKKMWNFIKPLVDMIMAWMPAIVSVVKFSIDGIIFVIKILLLSLQTFIDFFTGLVKFIIAIIEGDWAGAWEAFQDMINACLGFCEKYMEAFIDYLSDWAEDGLEMLYNFARGAVDFAGRLVNAIIDLLNNGLIKAFNGVIKMLNNIPGNNIPEADEIPHVNWSLPEFPGLAQGTVIPPSMGQFIARLGDNNAETEVVSPLSTIKQALIEAMQEAGGSGEYHIHVDLDGREVAKAVVRQNEMYKKSTGGRSLFA